MEEQKHITKFKILGDRLLIKISKTNESEGPLIMPDRQKEKPTYGEVVAIGDGQVGDKKHSINVNVGDMVMFQKWANNEIIQDVYMILKFSDVTAVQGGNHE